MAIDETTTERLEAAIMNLPPAYRDAFSSMYQHRAIDPIKEARMMAQYLDAQQRWIDGPWAFVRTWLMRAEAGRQYGNE